MMIYRSSIRPHHLKKVLKKGTLFALGGVGGLFVGALFMPVQVLSVWGLPLWIGAISAIGWGLIPYRKLRHLEWHPFELHIEDSRCALFQGNQCKALFATRDVARWEYVEKRNAYGIQVYFKNQREPLWLPYFSRSCLERISQEFSYPK